MKNLGFYLLTFACSISCCEESTPEVESEIIDAIITMPDLQECVCCGGYILQTGETSYNFEAFPSNASGDFKNLMYPESFPISVKVKFTPGRQCGNVKYITLTHIWKVNR